MTLQGIGVTQPAGMGSFRLRLKFGRYAYFAIELKKGEDAKGIAKKFRETSGTGGALEVVGRSVV